MTTLMDCLSYLKVYIYMIECICPVCTKTFKKTIGHYNRAKKMGLNIYCNKICAGVGRRKSVEEKKATKAAYDKKISRTEERKAAQKRYFQKSYKENPDKYKAIRKAKYKKHLEYLSTSEYKAYKKRYDEKYRFNKQYGEYAESAIILVELEKFLKLNMPNESKFQMGITNKTQKRKRLWKKIKNYQPQI